MTQLCHGTTGTGQGQALHREPGCHPSSRAQWDSHLLSFYKLCWTLLGTFYPTELWVSKRQEAQQSSAVQYWKNYYYKSNCSSSPMTGSKFWLGPLALGSRQLPQWLLTVTLPLEAPEALSTPELHTPRAVAYSFFPFLIRVHSTWLLLLQQHRATSSPQGNDRSTTERCYWFRAQLNLPLTSPVHKLFVNKK